ncbi:hypothetical protein BDV93DRAFT_604744, partial [Ceratobasidium sp. AG-I]
MTRKRTGPVGKSCLTCKYRRKKCDRGQPVCERCTRGEFECLGYEHMSTSDSGPIPGESSQQGEVIDGGITRSCLSLPLQFPDDAHPVVNNDWTMFYPFTPSSPKEQPPTSAAFPSSILDASTAPHPDNHMIHIFDNGEDNSTSRHNSLWSTDSRQLLPDWQACSSHQTYSRFSLPTLSGFDTAPEIVYQIAPLSLYPLTTSQSQVGQYVLPIPRGLPPEPTDVTNMINYVMTLYQKGIAHLDFKPLNHQSIKAQQSVVWRLQAGGPARWAMYLGAQISESMFDGVLPEKAATYDRQIQKFEQKLRSAPSRALTNEEIQTRLCGELEIGFMKLSLYNFHMLQLLRDCAPVFLQIISSNPTLWSRGQKSTSVSVAHTLASPRYELSHFILLDTFCSTAYAIPSTLEYDTSCPLFGTEAEIHPVGWVHGCPAEFHIALIDINARCALGRVAPDWQDIERRIMSWQPRLGNSADESYVHIAWLAVQESWRQALLAYLYMGVCGVASNDSRVQSAVRQIFRLLGTIQRQDPRMANVHFLIQYLVAGACTPNEKRRALIRSQLLDKY